jgi:hypothetical protein
LLPPCPVAPPLPLLPPVWPAPAAPPVPDWPPLPPGPDFEPHARVKMANPLTARLTIGRVSCEEFMVGYFSNMYAVMAPGTIGTGARPQRRKPQKSEAVPPPKSRSALRGYIFQPTSLEGSPYQHARGEVGSRARHGQDVVGVRV